MRTRNRKPRRGVLLLVVLSLLVLFVLAGLSFVVVTGQYRRGTIAISKIERSQTSPRKLMETAIGQVLNPPDAGIRPDDGSPFGSALAGHGLLEDIYGRDGFIGIVAATPPPSPLQPQNFAKISWLTPAPPRLIYYNGCVITMTTGTLTGRSSRIVDYSFTGPNNNQYTVTFIIEPFSGEVPSIGDAFVVNGRAFNGTGSGFLSTTGNLDLQHDYGTGGRELALLPRRVVASDSNSNGIFDNQDIATFNGGRDEDYDAADEQNMLLAQMSAVTGIRTPTHPNGGEVIIPSLHRPALINYWHNTLPNGLMDASAATRSLFRDICLRPSRFDHPQFSGSNSWLDPNLPGDVYLRRLIHGTEDANPLDGIPDDLNGDGSPDQLSTWDVDNDGDGLADSIWVDLGFPVETTADGRSYKPLFAILCVDLDGRVNLNTAGVWMDFALDTSGQMDQLAAGGTFPTASTGPFGPNPYGQGAGPAEINPVPILSGNTLPGGNLFDDYDYVVSERYKSRYNGDTWPGYFDAANPNSPDFAKPWWFAWSLPGQVNSALDVLGVDATAVDHAGRPVSTWAFGTYNQVTHFIDHPYEQNLVDLNGRDSSYSLADLEPMLRPFDQDVSKDGSRLASLNAFRNAVDALRRTRLVTTQSFDVPVPNVVYPKEMRSSPPPGFVGSNASIADIYYQRSSGAISTPAALAALLPFELWHGEKMNINRWFGDGDDNDANGVVDEPGEANSMAYVELMNDDPVFTANPAMQDPVRQMFARHLYSLLMFLRNKTVPLVDGMDANGFASARVAAQWAINVVDFCDPDSIMTPFEFDANPYDGWNVDGILGTAVNPSPDDGLQYRGIVWGCERPELLITETLAWHDRRVEDRDDEEVNRAGLPPNDPGGGSNWTPAKTDHPNTPDDDYDQFAMPVGTLFVELYNPNLGNGYVRQPQELYDANTGALQVNRLASDGSTVSPVWRLVMAKGGPADPTSGYFPDPDVEPIPATTEKRYVYFVSAQEYSSITPKASGDKEKDYFGNLPTMPVQVRPGQYLVVGSAGVQHPNDPNRHISIVGFDSGLSFPKSTLPVSGLYDDLRRIELVPGATDQYQVRIELNGGQEPGYGNPNPPNEIQQNVAFVAGLSRLGNDDPTLPQSVKLESLNVSLPLGGYKKLHTQFTLPTAQAYGKEVNAQGEFENEWVTGLVLDFELDRIGDQPNAAGEDRFQLVDTNGRSSSGTIPRYQAVYLQRLANPLKPFDPVVNPYLTVDKATIDLMVFNGLESNNAAMPFYAKQRGDRSMQIGTSVPSRNILSMEPSTKTVQEQPPTDPPWYLDSAPAASNGPLAPQNLDLVLHSTLGYLNNAFQPYFTSNNVPNGNLEYVGAPNTLFGNPPNPQTFPWLAWSNRPFANALELMNVPKTSPATMLEYFGINPAAASDVIFEGPHGTPPAPLGPQQRDAYLMPFLAARNGGSTAGMSTDDPGLCRLFDYVEVPSRFIGTSKWFDPSVNDPDKPLGFRAPNNRLRVFRDPGKVNLNTISDADVWEAIGASFGLTEPQLDAEWAAIQANMRGTIASNLTLDPTKPSAIPLPIRSASSSDLSPIMGDQGIKGRQASLVRLQDVMDNFLADPINGVTALRYRDRTRNPQFHYQELQKLSSMTTTHSNVYAVWMTIGYFEVKPWYDANADGILDTSPAAQPTKDAAHPDGLMLADELGQDTGQITRHRAFYIIDRSIPVAFEPGKEHNSKDAIVLERFIE